MPLYTVPKFTEMETKIVGPLTLKQAIFVFVTVGICFLIYKALPSFISLPLAIFVAALGLSLTFLKVGEMPLYQVFLHSIKFFLSPKIFFWGKGRKIEKLPLGEIEIKKMEKEGKVSLRKESKLNEIAIKTLTKK